MRLTVVVGTYNRLDQIRACVDSVLEQTKTPFILHVTDAGSTDGTEDYLRGLSDPRIKVSLVGRKLGQARAYNDVFQQVETPYVCWISDDNVIVNNGLDLGVAILDENPGFGMVGLKVQDKLGPFTDAPYIGGLSMLGVLNVNQGMLRTEVMRQVGGFSEAFRDYGIDPDLTAKVLFSGWDIAYTRAVAIHHYRNWSVEKGTPEHAQIWARQKRYLEMYQEKYAPIAGGDRLWEWKKKAWRLIERRYPSLAAVNCHQPVLGALPRDWKNQFNGRYISVFDSLLTSGRRHHLVQHCPARLLPAQLPQDPAPASA